MLPCGVPSRHVSELTSLFCDVYVFFCQNIEHCIVLDFNKDLVSMAG